MLNKYGNLSHTITYDELLGLIVELEQAKLDCRKYKLTGLAMAVQLGEK